MSKDDWSGILVYIESGHGKISEVSLELLGKAEELADRQQETIAAVCIGSEVASVKEQLQGYPVTRFYGYTVEEEFQAHIYEQMMVDCVQSEKPAIVLIGGTFQGRALAPRIAVAFRTGLTADCTQLELDEDGNLIQIRPAFGGNIMASILTEHSRPQIATVRSGIFAKPVRRQRKTISKSVIRHIKSTKKRAKEIESDHIVRVDGIEKQQVLVVAGRGVKRREDLEMLRELAACLGGKLASSRALVEKGWMDPAEQIGLSGTTVSPKCILTFGVSGTVQFMAGMKNTPNIIAVNNDPDARIFEIAHYPICGDLYEIVPEMLAELKGRE